MMNRIHGFSTVTPDAACDAVAPIVRHANATTLSAIQFGRRRLALRGVSERVLSIFIVILLALSLAARTSTQEREARHLLKPDGGFPSQRS
jgi:hypothetical protein